MHTYIRACMHTYVHTLGHKRRPGTSFLRPSLSVHYRPVSPLTPCGQDPFWKVCMAKFGDRKDELNRGLVDFTTIATKAAKHFAKNLPDV